MFWFFSSNFPLFSLCPFQAAPDKHKCRPVSPGKRCWYTLHFLMPFHETYPTSQFAEHLDRTDGDWAFEKRKKKASWECSSPRQQVKYRRGKKTFWSVTTWFGDQVAEGTEALCFGERKAAFPGNAETALRLCWHLELSAMTQWLPAAGSICSYVHIRTENPLCFFYKGTLH